MKKKFLGRLAVMFFLCGLVSGADAAINYTETWDSDLSGWGQNTIYTDVEWQPVGGNPGGFLHTTGTGGFTGAYTNKDELTGNYNFSNFIEVSVDLFSDSSTMPTVIRFRYKSPAYNGWYYPLGDVASSQWQTYSFEFNPSWSDNQAFAAGWSTDEGINPSYTTIVSFSETMSDVWSVEARGLRSGNLDIDNFKISPIPIPGAIWLFASGLAGVIVYRRKKQN
ncbi:MAG: hypothetical protein DRG59_10515 [Deltaproteobacteria bacterium]|nr:MAG: hypothetical protein DRG59_10515 [Deltaproteobacteria bacterium]